MLLNLEFSRNDNFLTIGVINASLCEDLYMCSTWLGNLQRIVCLALRLQDTLSWHLI